MAIVAIVEGNAESSRQARAMPGTLKDVYHTQVSNCLGRHSYLRIRYREMSKNVRMS